MKIPNPFRTHQPRPAEDETLDVETMCRAHQGIRPDTPLNKRLSIVVANLGRGITFAEASLIMSLWGPQEIGGQTSSKTITLQLQSEREFSPYTAAALAWLQVNNPAVFPTSTTLGQPWNR